MKKNKGNIPTQRKRAKARAKNYLLEYKKNESCVNCGYNKHPEILQFHHLNPKEKSKEISRLLTQNKSINRVKKEMTKCILLCPNCHIWLHYIIKEKDLNY